MPNYSSYKQVLQKTTPARASFLEALKCLGVDRNIPNISWNTSLFLAQELHEKPMKNILEIGPANGFSTLILRVASPKAHIISIECSRHAFEELRINIQNFHTSPLNTPAFLEPKITSSVFQENIHNHTLYYADACELMPYFLSGGDECHLLHPKSIIHSVPAIKFDFIFIDGAFRMTKDFFELSLPLLEPGGWIIIDDAIKYAWKMNTFYEYLVSSGIEYELVQTDEDDGVMVIRI